jgi:Protein of unknown function (DUF2541)
MKFKILAVGLAFALAAFTPAHAQRGGGGGTWELLGEERVGLGNDRDVINLGKSEDYYKNRSYRRLRFVVEGGEVRMKSVRLIFLNGQNEDLDISRTLRPGENFDVDLRSERSYLRQIQLNYTGKFGFSLGGGGLKVNQATVRIFGENTRGGGGGGRDEVVSRPRTVIPPGWNELAREGFDRRDATVQIRVGRREGRIGQIRFQNDGDKVDIREVSLRFANGETQNIRLNNPLETGEVTRPIDVEGDRRVIESMTIRLNPGRRSGQAELIVLGTERPGREDGGRGDSGGGRRDWVALGEQSVGFGVDKDVIRINQSEDFYRNRGFDKLHFVAEGNDVHMMAIRVVYMNDHVEDVRIDRLIRAGTDLAVDLPGRRSYLRAVEMTYRSRPGYGGRAVVKVFGEAAQGRR